MTDIRQRIEEDQGILKKIQNFVPGFRGYRRREDLRDSDRMLRAQLAQKLGTIREDLEEVRKTLVKGNKMQELDDIGGLINQFKKLEGQVAHAETGYSGLVADIEIMEDELRSLYEFDAGMLDHISSIDQSMGSLRSSLNSSDTHDISGDVVNIGSDLSGFEKHFDRRMQIIGRTEV